MVLIGHSISDGDGRILTMDGSVADLMHRSVREVTGLSYVALTHPDDVAMNVDRVGRLAIGVAPTKLRKRYLRPDGSTVLVDIHVSRLMAAQNEGRLVGTIYRVSAEDTDTEPHRLWQAVHVADAVLRERRAVLGEDIFADYGWMVLTQVYIAEAECRVADAFSIGDSIGIGTVRAERWIRALESKALVERPVRQNGAVQLTACGLALVERLLGSTLAG